jgi:ATP-dependent RNA helicase DDX19/DBP5
MGFDKPSAIQAYSLPRILATPPMNLIAQAQSGSGKTAAFVLGMLYRVVVDEPATCQAVCVTPTRELAVQIVQNCLAPMSANIEGIRMRMGVSGEMISRGEGVGAHIVVGTPGKVCDWLKKRSINPTTVKVLVLDEADEMCNESSHRTNSLLIKKAMPPTCQCLFFSATFPKEVLDFAEKLVGQADKILISSDEELVLDVIKQLWIDTGTYQGGKRQFLEDMYSFLEIGQSIVFVETRKEADEVTQILNAKGYPCSVLHGKVENEERDRLMESFRVGQTKVLITTNVLARGVDIDNVCLVVNYDMPRQRNQETGVWSPDFETYLHRIGRTGRFGRKGTAINLVQDDNAKRTLAEIEQHFAPGKEMIAQCEADVEALADKVELS